MKAYQAYGPAGRVTKPTAQEAALTYFEQFPRSRKCTVTEGTVDGPFFTVRYGRKSEGKWPENFKDVTKAQAQDPATFTSERGLS